MYLIGTNVVSEARKRGKANGGVRRFFDEARAGEERVYVECDYHRRDTPRRWSSSATAAMHGRQGGWRHGSN